MTRISVFLLGWFAAVSLLASCAGTPKAVEETPPRFQVLVFSKTEGFRHDVIPAGIAAVRQLGQAHGFGVVATEEAAFFHPDTLSRYAAVVFLNTTGDVLDAEQQAAFEAYIEGGGGFVGVHAAADTEYDWEWYGTLVGGYFESHPDQQDATVLVTDRSHPSTQHLPTRWTRFDEWYNYRANPRGDVHVLAALDERSYEGGTMGHDHPIAWAHEIEAGRAWYTGLGHTAASYADPLYLEHLYGGIAWTAGVQPADVSMTQADHYEVVTLTEAVTDPMELAIASDGRVFIVERFGAIKCWYPDTGETRVVGWIPVNKVIEEGLLGITLDPRFDETGWFYIYYTPADDGPNRLSRMTLVDDHVDRSSEKVLLEVKTQRKYCCHSAGSLTFDAQGNLYLSTGDNSSGPRQGTSVDERPGHHYSDVQRSSANTNDLRGKILRIRPQDDGTYTIPEGNLFEGDARHRPEIYTMGHRNPFRIAVDPETGWLFWGDVGSGRSPSEHGPWGWDEFNRAKEPGFFGWPYFVGPNEAYRDFNFATEEMGDPFDPARPINDSPNNTGVQALPSAQPALMWYTYGMSEDFPELGAGGINPMAGPLYRYEAERAAPGALPPYYDGRWIIYEWMRHWVQVVTFDAQSEILKIDPFLPGIDFVRPMDMEVGPDGRLYVIEWGDEFWGSNPNAQVVRLDYVGASERPPRIQAIEAELSEPVVAIEWPVDGGFFDFEESIAYRVAVASGATVPAGQVTVQPYTGFDTYALPLAAQSGPEGTFEVTRAYTHTPDMHLADRFAELEACSTDAAGHRSCDRVKLHPKQKEAEHVSTNQGVVRKTYGIHPAAEGYAATALTVMIAENGDQVAYAPVNLTGIDTLTFRFKPLASRTGMVEARLDAAAGPLLASVSVDTTVGSSVRPPQADVIEAMRRQEGANLRSLDQSGYQGWREVTVPVTDPGGTHKLVLVFQSDEPQAFVELDWIRFEGKGVGR